MQSHTALILRDYEVFNWIHKVESPASDNRNIFTNRAPFSVGLQFRQTQEIGQCEAAPVSGSTSSFRITTIDYADVWRYASLPGHREVGFVNGALASGRFKKESAGN